jgi:hypothetical protein
MVKAFRRCTTAVAVTLAIVGAMAVSTTPTSNGDVAPGASPTPVGVAAVQVPVTPDRGGHRIGTDSAHSAPQERAAQGSRWPRTTLTYGFDNHTGDLSIAAQEQAIAAAFNSWAAVSPLTFRKVADCGLPFDAANCTTPDIRISWGTRTHTAAGFDPAFDGQGGTAAHAFYPPPNGASAAGDLHLDDAERWTTTGNGVDLQSIALHELGHALGLAHASALQCPPLPGSNRPIMCSIIIGVDRTLARDDINGIQGIYGLPPLSCGGRAVTVDLRQGERPTSRADVIFGTTGADRITAGGGNDIVCAGGGNDVIDLGTGNDRAIGGNGNDTVFGRDGADRLEGGPGADRLYGGNQDDVMYGGTGSDVVDGGMNADSLNGGTQSDVCNGRSGRDRSTSCERAAAIESRRA